MDDSYYIRDRGKVQGPFDITTLHSMARRGRFARHYDVSPDGENWYVAVDYPELFQEIIDLTDDPILAEPQSPVPPMLANPTNEIPLLEPSSERIKPAQVSTAPTRQSDNQWNHESKNKSVAILGLSWPIWLIGFLLLIIIAFATYTMWPRKDWKEHVATLADKSVVKIYIPKKVGTGFVIASKGNRHLILTNRHVVEENLEVLIKLRSNQESRGKVVGKPRSSDVDLALVVVHMKGLEPLGPIAEFDSINIGEEVAAIGHPLGLFDFSLTYGNISAKRLGLHLQHDASISSGNSGGPLINQNGDVVGVNTQVFTSNTQHANSLYFATRADYVFDHDLWSFSEDISDLLNRIDR